MLSSVQSDNTDLIIRTLKTAPFVIFSKTAPDTLPDYNEDTDFTYYFFNDAMMRESGLDPHFLTPDRNAKTDFPPEDYPAYFLDDVAVCIDYPFPKYKIITEPWSPPGTSTIVETRKTSVQILDQLFMLGWFSPHDDVELGVTTFKADKVPETLPLLDHVPSDWYEGAFDQLPLAIRVINSGDGTTIIENQMALDSFLDHDTIQGCLDLIKGAGSHYSAFQYGNKMYNDKPSRIWAWHLDDDNVAIAVRSKHETIPNLVQSALAKNESRGKSAKSVKGSKSK
jgi:hypothetical protein